MLGLVDPKFISDIFSSVFAKDYEKIIEYIKTLEEYEPEMVVDELIAYLKEKMYNQDAHFSTLVLDRFFRILSDSKIMFSINADGSFVLSLIFFKMIEALKIKEIDQMIESMQKDIKLPEPVTIKVQSTTPEQVPIEQKRVESKPTIVEQSKDSNKDIFIALIAKIKDRNYQLGECFVQSITFVSFQNNILTWQSCADEDCKKVLRHGYSVIKQLVRELFDFQTQIKGVACTKRIEKKVEVPIQNPEPVMQEFQAPSMIEDIEIGGGESCVTNCSEEMQEAVKQVDGTDIIQQPMVVKAIELFEAKKVTVQSKI
jgi:DNA polymerase-3 subunit gamma/tau